MAYVTNVVIDQGGAGTTTLLASPGPDWALEVINYLVVLSADGTFAFQDGTNWMSGDVPVSAKSGAVAASDSDHPLMITGKGKPLQITTTGGSAHGHALVRVK